MEGGSPDLVEGLTKDKDRTMFVKKVKIGSEPYAIKAVYVQPLAHYAHSLQN